MELFYSCDIQDSVVRLDADESAHCVRVLRHRAGDEISVIDGCGTLYRCLLADADPKGAVASVQETVRGFGAHPYRLSMAVCPTKNSDRYEWFAEKATEMGVDSIVPVTGEHSERRSVNASRLSRIVLSATKQSLKGAVPEIAAPLSVRDFIASDRGGLKLICCCFEPEGGRISMRRALDREFPEDSPEISVLIGPEGDFSPVELALAMEYGWIPVHLGDSRLRTETAAVFAVAEVYSRFTV